MREMIACIDFCDFPTFVKIAMLNNAKGCKGCNTEEVPKSLVRVLNITIKGTFSGSRDSLNYNNPLHVVRIDIDKTFGDRIQGSVPKKDLFRNFHQNQISEKTKLWKSSDDIYTATEVVSSGLTFKRYLPSQAESNSGNDSESKPVIRSFLIDENGTYTELQAMNKKGNSHSSDVVGLDYRKTKTEAFENPAFDGSKHSVTFETDLTTEPVTYETHNKSSIKENGKSVDKTSSSKHQAVEKSNNVTLTNDGKVHANGKITPTAEILPIIHASEKSSTVSISIPDGDIRETSKTQTPTDKNKRNGSNGIIGENDDVEDEEIKWLSWMEGQFKKIAGEDGEISLDEFKNALGVKKSFFAERFFTLFDSDKSGSIECEELMVGLRKLTKGTPAEKLKFLFDVYDVDGSGTIDIDELKTVLRSCMEESSLKLSESDLDSLTALLFESADDDGSGEITFDELKAELEKHPGVIENLTISAAQWLKPPGEKKKKGGVSRYFTKRYIFNNLRKVLFFLWYVLANIAFGVYAAWNYRNSNGFIIAARICGMNLNFNCMFILVLMLRKSLTYLRMTKVALILPLDQHILFHKMVGVMIAVYSIIHTVAHFGNAILLDNSREDLELWEILFTTKAGYGWVYDTAILTGWALDIIVVIMLICSMPFVRRSGYFQVFYWTHMLYVPFWILVIIHGSNFWKWFVAPGLIFILEKVSRSKFIKRARYGHTYVEEITLLPSGVTHLEITRPSNFSYQPGDYLFIQIPVIAQHEWHPFTISSAPEMDGRIWLHVRSAGHWTNKLYEYFEKYDPGFNVDDNDDIEDQVEIFDEIEKRRRSTVHNRRKSTIEVLSDITLARRPSKPGGRKLSMKFPEELTNPIEAARQSRINSKNKRVKIKCFLDGPYGTATREIFDTEHAVLVGAGIGVTPMASILQSIMYRYKESKRTCPRCSYCWFGQLPKASMKTRKVEFVWINRDQKAFEWFVSLLTNLEIEQSLDNEESDDSKIIEMHMYMTAAQKKTDMKGIGLQIALDLMHEKSNKDLITGLKTKTQPGRPDWNKLFQQFSEEKKGKVKVFFCGAPQLGKIVKETAEKFGYSFSKENF